MLVLLVKRGDSSSERWFWVPLVHCLRKVPITHYKPGPSGGADDILQLEHTGIYKLQTALDPSAPSELTETINSIYDLQCLDNLLLDESTLANAYETFSKVMPLFTICSTSLITHDGNEVLQCEITGWADDFSTRDVIIFGKLNVYKTSSNTSITQVGLLSIPKDTKEVRLVSINRSVVNNTIRYEHNELISYAINNTVMIGSNSYNPNTLNLHIYIGDIAVLKVTQQSTYIINTKTKNVTRHIYPPTVHGYGTTLMPVKGNQIISNVVEDYIDLYIAQEDNNQLFYDVLL